MVQRGGQMDWEMDILDKTEMDSILCSEVILLILRKMHILKLKNLWCRKSTSNKYDGGNIKRKGIRPLYFT